MVNKTLDAFGCLDYAYDNAGVQNELVQGVDQTMIDFNRVTTINYQGAWSCMKYKLKYMSKFPSLKCSFRLH